MPDDHDRMAHMVGDARKRAMESSYAHTWVPDDDEGMYICSECDTYRGSAGSLKDCPALLDQDAETRSAL